MEDMEEIKIYKEHGETIMSGFEKILIEKANNNRAYFDYDGFIVTTDMVPSNYRVLPKSQVLEIMKANAIAELDKRNNEGKVK